MKSSRLVAVSGLATAFLVVAAPVALGCTTDGAPSPAGAVTESASHSPGDSRSSGEGSGSGSHDGSGNSAGSGNSDGSGNAGVGTESAGSGSDGASVLSALPAGGLLGVAGGFTEFATGGATRSTDDEGAVAFGGPVSLDHFAIGQNIAATGARYGLVAGGPVSGSVVFESGATGVSAGPVQASVTPVGAIGRGGLPFDFAAVGEHLSEVSSALGALHPTAGTSVRSTAGDLVLAGTSPTLDVFDVPAGVFASATRLDLNVPSSATVVVNVAGASVASSLGYMVYNGEQAQQYDPNPAGVLRDHTLFNFPQARSVSFSHLELDGHVLAPGAAFSFNGGHSDGSIMARTISGDFQANTTPPFTGTVTPPVACPAGGLLGVAGGFTEFATGGATRSTDDEGAVAFGGPVSLDHFAIGQNIAATGARYGLVAGGPVSGSVVFESGATGVSAGPVQASVTPVGAIGRGGLPFDFAAVGEHLSEVSSALGALHPTAGTSVRSTAGDLVLAGTSPTLDVFDVPAGVFASATRLDLNVPSSATVVVNVAGASVASSLGYMVYNGEQAQQYDPNPAGVLRDHTLFNFPQARSVSFSHLELDGHVLAPGAAFSFNGGHSDGSIMARTISGDFQANTTPPFTGCDLQVQTSAAHGQSWSGAEGSSASHEHSSQSAVTSGRGEGGS